MTDLPAGVTDADLERAALATINAERKVFGGDMAPIVDLSNVMPEAIEHHKILARAALTAALAGRVVVPREPTEAMIDALFKAMRHDPSCAPFSKRILLKGYDAMIAAAVEGEA